MKFMICSTDEYNFDYLVGWTPVLGTEERFVITVDDYNEVPDDIRVNIVVEIDSI